MTINPLSHSATNMMKLLTDLWPLHRTLNCDDMDRALDRCGEYLDDTRWQIHEYPVNSDAFTWWIPERYHVNEAWLEINGERVADFRENPLHLLSYSLPIEFDGRLGEIKEHLWTSKIRPDAIPWEFKYYERSWGFCLAHNVLSRFDDDAHVRALIDVEFKDTPFRLGEIYLPGETDEDVMFLTNICHPMQVNDSIAGLVVALEMAKVLANQTSRKYGFRVLVVPETIGTLAWMSNHEEDFNRVSYAWFCEMVGFDNPFNLQHSRQGTEALLDKAFLTVLKNHRRHGEERTGSFREVVASDEMITNGPGFDIPTPSLTRWPYDEYHTSDDSPAITKSENLQEALSVFLELWSILETNYYPQRRFKGPVMLSRFGLWIDWRINKELNLATEKLMLLLEGTHSIIDIAYELNLTFSDVFHYLEKFREAELIEKSDQPWLQPAP
jgi:aminopeptidase-like protein